MTLLVGLKKGFTASGNVADSHCVPILAPCPHGIIHKGENQMRMQSYMFFFEIGKKERDIFGVICIILWIKVNRTAMILCQRGGLFIILDHYAKVH